MLSFSHPTGFICVCCFKSISVLHKYPSCSFLYVSCFRVSLSSLFHCLQFFLSTLFFFISSFILPPSPPSDLFFLPSSCTWDVLWSTQQRDNKLPSYICWCQVKTLYLQRVGLYQETVFSILQEATLLISSRLGEKWGLLQEYQQLQMHISDSSDLILVTFSQTCKQPVWLLDWH